MCVWGGGAGPWGSEGQACKTLLSLDTGLHVAPGTKWPADRCLDTSHDGGTDFHPVQLGNVEKFSRRLLVLTRKFHSRKTTQYKGKMCRKRFAVTG